MSTVELACVTFEEDARLTVLQVLSVDRLFDHSGLERYTLILNGTHADELENFITEHALTQVTPELKAKVRFARDSEVLRGCPEIGRRTQQLLKLLFAEQASSDYYLLLDAKNHFVHKSSVADFFARSGQPKSVFRKPSPALENYARASLEVFDRDQSALEHALPTITPYLMKTYEVNDMVRRLEEKYDMPLTESFDTVLRATTEFFLYYAHLLSSGRPMPYVDAPPLVTTLFTKWPEDHRLVLRLIEQAQEGASPMFGLHRLRLPQLTSDEKEAIEALWRMELLGDDESASWFLESQRSE